MGGRAKKYIREQRTVCGESYMEVDYLHVNEQEHTASPRRKRALAASITQTKANGAREQRYFVQKLNANFDKYGFHVSCTFNNTYLPATAEDDARVFYNYIRKLRRFCKAHEWNAPWWMEVPEDAESDDPEKPGRFHHHVAIQADKTVNGVRVPLSHTERETFRTALEGLWGENSRSWDYMEHGAELSYGYVNADRLQPNEDNLDGMARYITKKLKAKMENGESTGGARCWHCSKGLKEPTYPRPNDSRWSAGKLAEACTKYIDDAEYWEKRFPGYRFYSAHASFNEDRAEWRLYIRLRKFALGINARPPAHK